MTSSAPSPTDPEAWTAYLAEGNAKQARKRVSADAIVRDPQGRVLLVKPTYKPGWDLPGGMAEANEAPEDAVRRELLEELALNVRLRGLLVLDWVASHGPWDDQFALVFDGGSLHESEVGALRPQETDGEVGKVAFLRPGAAASLLPQRTSLRFSEAMNSLAAGQPSYLRNGRPVFPRG
ncbi:NUDIX domain-containing protein [Streptomyces sp. NPDC059853]|uniref:NUDIX domain-containing protein n=1 Tax=Streptomyces sp. NPDC059853 TaxID=3346973 RepID=UPI00365EE6FA